MLKGGAAGGAGGAGGAGQVVPAVIVVVGGGGAVIRLDLHICHINHTTWLGWSYSPRTHRR